MEEIKELFQVQVLVGLQVFPGQAQEHVILELHFQAPELFLAQILVVMASVLAIWAFQQAIQV